MNPTMNDYAIFPAPRVLARWTPHLITVSQNCKRFREKADVLIKKHDNLSVVFPSIEFCTDNAAMIAIAGYYKILDNKLSNYDLTAIPNLSLKNR